jgi:hypothetical protein
MQSRHSFIHSEEAYLTWIKRDLYYDAFKKPLGFPLEAICAKNPRHSPTVLTKAEAPKVIEGRPFVSVTAR